MNKHNLKGRIDLINVILFISFFACICYEAYWGIQYMKSIVESEYIKNEYTFENTKSQKLFSKWYILNVDHKALYKQNNDYIGWIQIPDTRLSYPVYKSSDNEDYLHHNAKGEYSYAGCIFMDCKNNSIDDFNIILYGHNMRVGTMFHILKKYTNIEYYNKHPVVIFYPRDGKERIYQIYSSYSKNISELKPSAYKLSFITSKDKSDFIKLSKAMSIIDTSQQIDTDTKILTLSTCTSSSGERLIVQAYLIDDAAKND